MTKSKPRTKNRQRSASGRSEISQRPNMQAAVREDGDIKMQSGEAKIVGTDSVKDKLAVLQARNESKISKQRSLKGVSKKQRQRQNRLIERAEEVKDRQEKNVNASKKRARAIQRRRADWNDLNEEIVKSNSSLNPRVRSNAFENLASEERNGEDVTKSNADMQLEAVGPQNDTSLQTVLEIRSKLDGLDEII